MEITSIMPSWFEKFFRHFSEARYVVITSLMTLDDVSVNFNTNWWLIRVFKYKLAIRNWLRFGTCPRRTPIAHNGMAACTKGLGCSIIHNILFKRPKNWYPWNWYPGDIYPIWAKQCLKSFELPNLITAHAQWAHLNQCFFFGKIKPNSPDFYDKFE